MLASCIDSMLGVRLRLDRLARLYTISWGYPCACSASRRMDAPAGPPPLAPAAAGGWRSPLPLLPPSPPPPPPPLGVPGVVGGRSPRSLGAGGIASPVPRGIIIVRRSFQETSSVSPSSYWRRKPVCWSNSMTVPRKVPCPLNCLNTTSPRISDGLRTGGTALSSSFSRPVTIRVSSELCVSSSAALIAARLSSHPLSDPASSAPHRACSGSSSRATLGRSSHTLSCPCQRLPHE
mmetsp:Transcript_44342/g.147032  ORF Transcript_44342/g.147032 Transcript_44342/m.147032 type:complete len:235 (+) Transcript_44342:54-758(+)